MAIPSRCCIDIAATSNRVDLLKKASSMEARIFSGEEIMKLSAVILTGIAVLTAASLSAQTNAPSIFKTGDQLYAACTSEQASELDKCDWFVMASHDMSSYFQDTDKAPKVFCSPEGLTAGALRTVVIEYLRSRPDSRQYSAVSNVQNAIEASYPCEL